MNTVKAMATDPVCGMSVDEVTAVHADLDGKTYYFCGETCRKKFLAPQRGVKSDSQSAGCDLPG